MNTYPFKQVDVFAGQPLSGNPVAVTLNAAGLSTADMQSLARWTNLSETTFVLPGTPGVSDYTSGSSRLTVNCPSLGTPRLERPMRCWKRASSKRGRAGWCNPAMLA